MGRRNKHCDLLPKGPCGTKKTLRVVNHYGNSNLRCPEVLEEVLNEVLRRPHLKKTMTGEAHPFMSFFLLVIFLYDLGGHFGGTFGPHFDPTFPILPLFFPVFWPLGLVWQLEG